MARCSTHWPWLNKIEGFVLVYTRILLMTVVLCLCEHKSQIVLSETVVVKGKVKFLLHRTTLSEVNTWSPAFYLQSQGAIFYQATRNVSYPVVGLRDIGSTIDFFCTGSGSSFSSTCWIWWKVSVSFWPIFRTTNRKYCTVCCVHQWPNQLLFHQLKAPQSPARLRISTVSVSFPIRAIPKAVLLLLFLILRLAPGL